MKTFIYLFFFVPMMTSTWAWALDQDEEAIILNQELQFLEESAEIPLGAHSRRPSPSRSISSQSLEQKYFGDKEDTVGTRTSGFKRRSL